MSGHVRTGRSGPDGASSAACVLPARQFLSRRAKCRPRCGGLPRGRRPCGRLNNSVREPDPICDASRLFVRCWLLFPGAERACRPLMRTGHAVPAVLRDHVVDGVVDQRPDVDDPVHTVGKSFGDLGGAAVLDLPAQGDDTLVNLNLHFRSGQP